MKGRNIEFIAQAVKILKPRKPLTSSTLKNLSPINEGETEVHILHETEQISKF